MVPILCHNNALVNKHQWCVCCYVKCDRIVKVTHEPKILQVEPACAWQSRKWILCNLCALTRNYYLLLLFGPVTFCECCITFVEWNQLLWYESVQIFGVAVRNDYYWVGWKDTRISQSNAVVKRFFFFNGMIFCCLMETSCSKKKELVSIFRLSFKFYVVSRFVSLWSRKQLYLGLLEAPSMQGSQINIS